MKFNKEMFKYILQRLRETITHIIYDNRGSFEVDQEVLDKLARFYLPYIQEFYAKKRKKEVEDLAALSETETLKE